MCKCTSFTHDDVRRADRRAGAARRSRRSCRSCTGSTPDGCSSCRPALNYYLLCALPGDYVDDQQSRFVNERHARQHPEGRHLFGRAAHVGRADQSARAARDRRCGREVQRADGQGDRRPAARHLRDQEGGPARGLGRPQRRRDGLGPCLWQGAAHGEDLRRQRNGAASARRIRPAWASRSSR